MDRAWEIAAALDFVAECRGKAAAIHIGPNSERLAEKLLVMRRIPTERAPLDAIGKQRFARAFENLSEEGKDRLSVRVQPFKQASEFAYISEVPIAGEHFSNQRLENDYMFKHPVISTLHPAPWVGAALGAVVGRRLHKNLLGSAMIGGSAGLLAEGAHRLNFLLGARKQLQAGKNPLDRRFAKL